MSEQDPEEVHDGRPSPQSQFNDGVLICVAEMVVADESGVGCFQGSGTDCRFRRRIIRGAAETKLSQNSGHTKHRSTVGRRYVERHRRPNPLPAGEGAEEIPSFPFGGEGQGEGVCHDYHGLPAFETRSDSYSDLPGTVSRGQRIFEAFCLGAFQDSRKEMVQQ